MGSAKRLQTEVIAIGTELLLGQVMDTNSSRLGRKLARIGIRLSQITAVGDELHRIVEVLKTGLDRSDILITTGGLGPTEDDLTREAVAAATGQKLAFQPELMKDIEALFKARGFRMTPNNRKQAYIPSGAIAIRNPMGTAPAFIVEDPRGIVISLPGVPRELEYLLDRVVIPYLRKKNRLGRQVILTRVLRVCGLGESGVDRQIGDLIRNSQNPSIGLLASPGDIKISIVCHARSRREAAPLIEGIEKQIRNRLGILVYGVDTETLEAKVAAYLTRLNLRLSVADAFTGGLFCHRILGTGTRRFAQGFVLPSRRAQMSFLRLPAKAFSSLVKNQEIYAVTLAKNTLEHADVGLAVTSDFKGSDGELRGTLAIAIAERGKEQSQSWKIGGTREGLTQRAAIIALDALRRYLLGKASVER
ncbi:MAG: CinA family nicotinamide mononucleotide deamidase-related protein [Proteobacteria bacterium]|nr:CinA family nicotinamide mononucleotide deamidase-related protein [Pseudomonadota bacterium]NIS71684.1 CinA family nicotinamide mononucleotide deamidase-related protein [Pseudomonadota bacterium]